MVNMVLFTMYKEDREGLASLDRLDICICVINYLLSR